MLQSDDIRVIKKAHGLQLTVLVTLILKNLLYGNSLTRLQAFSLQKIEIKLAAAPDYTLKYTAQYFISCNR
jgi:hypothetical protein